MRGFAQLWRAAERIVYSTTLDRMSTAGTRIEGTFDPVAVRRTTATTGPEVTVGGPDLAARALRIGPVDEYPLLVAPVAVGGGTAPLPGGVRLDLNLLDGRRFSSGMVFLRYRISMRADGAVAATPAPVRASYADPHLVRPASTVAPSLGLSTGERSTYRAESDRAATIGNAFGMGGRPLFDSPLGWDPYRPNSNATS